MALRRSDRAVWLVPSLVLFVLVPVGFAVYTAVSGSRSDGGGGLSRDGSEVVAREPRSPLSMESEPTTFVVAYRVERYDDDRTQVTEETAEIRRPFDARVTTRVDGRVVATRTSGFGSLTIGTGQGPRILVSPPAPATSDLRLVTSVPDAVSRGFLEVRERRRVLRRECQVYRSGATVVAGDLVPVGSRAGEHADFCVDSRGLLLEEVWVRDGRAIQRRVATRVDVGVDFADSRFSLSGEEPLSTEEGNGLFRPIDPASSFEGTTYRLASDPAGFAYLGRYVVQPPSLKTFDDPLSDDSNAPAQVSIIDVWSRGRDVLTLAQTIVADPSSVAPPGEATVSLDVGIPGLEGLLTIDLRANEVRILLPEGRLLRLGGTLAANELEALLPTLRAEAGTGIRLLEPSN